MRACCVGLRPYELIALFRRERVQITPHCHSLINAGQTRMRESLLKAAATGQDQADPRPGILHHVGHATQLFKHPGRKQVGLIDNQCHAAWAPAIG